jgi:hypothetical protein
LSHNKSRILSVGFKTNFRPFQKGFRSSESWKTGIKDNRPASGIEIMVNLSHHLNFPCSPIKLEWFYLCMLSGTSTEKPIEEVFNNRKIYYLTKSVQQYLTPLTSYSRVWLHFSPVVHSACSSMCWQYPLRLASLLNKSCLPKTSRTKCLLSYIQQESNILCSYGLSLRISRHFLRNLC